MRAQQLRRKLMRHSIGVVIAAALFLGVAAPAETQDLGGTLKKVRETGVIAIGHRDSSMPLSYLDDKLEPVVFSIELGKHVVERVKPNLALPNLTDQLNPVTSPSRLLLVTNGPVDINS